MLRKYTCEPLDRLKILVISHHTVGDEVSDACEEEDDLLFQEYKQAPHKYTFVAPFQRIRAKPGRLRRKKALPGTAAGTVRWRAVTVAMATCSGVYFLVQACPAVTMFGFSRVPSR